MSALIDSKREKALFGVLALALAGLLGFLIFAWPGFNGTEQAEDPQADVPERDLALPEMLPHSEEEYQQALDLAHAFTSAYLQVDTSESHNARNERLAEFGTPSYAEFLRNETPPAAAQDRSSTEFRSESRTQEASISELDTDSLTFEMRTTSTVHDAENSHEEEEEEEEDFFLTVELVNGEWGVSSFRASEEGSL